MSTDLVPAGQYVRSYWHNEEHALAKFAGGAGLIGAVLGTFGTGGIGAFIALPVLFTAFGAMIGHMFVPSNDSFREAVRMRLQEEAEAYEESKLSEAVCVDHSNTYWEMRRRMNEVEGMVVGRPGVMLGSTWEMFKNTPLNYLRLAYAAAQFQKAAHGTTEQEIRDEIAKLEDRIANSKGDERRRYASAKAQLTKVLTRKKSQDSRAAMVNARLIVMKNDFDEVCTHLVKNPASGVEGEVIKDLISRFDVEEEMSLFLSDEGESLDAQIASLGVPEEALYGDDSSDYEEEEYEVSEAEVDAFLLNGR